MKVLLINPDQGQALASEAGDLPQTGSGPYPPLGLLYLQAAVSASGPHRVELLDANLPGGLAPALARHRDGVGLVGITALTPNLPSVVLAVAEARAACPEAAVVLGGPHADIFPHQTARLQGVDYVLTGEAEHSLSRLVQALEQGQPEPEIQGLYSAHSADDELCACAQIPDLDQLPNPDRSRLQVEHYRGIGGQDVQFATVITSRGCPWRCTFCSTPQGRPRLRSVEAIVEELEQCAALGMQHVYFVDDTFPVAGRRFHQLMEQLILRAHLPAWSCRTASAGLTADNMALMKRAGCERIQIGVETCTDEGLRVLGKKTTIAQIRQTFAACRAAGVPSMAYFMLGLPNERTPADVRRLNRFARELDPDYAMFNVLTLYPGTRLLDQAARRGLVDAEVWHRFAEQPDRGFVPPVWDEHLGREELYALQSEAYRAFYLRPRVVLRQLLAGGGLGRKVRAGAQMLLGRLTGGQEERA